MDDAPAPSPPRRRPSTAAEWAIVRALSALTVAALIPPGYYVWPHAGDNTMDWRTNQAQHAAAARLDA